MTSEAVVYIASVEFYKADLIWDFTVADWSNYAAGGVISHNSGKTTSAAIEVARAVTNQDPHGKYPKQGDVFVVGKDWQHMGDVIYKMLFLPGAFKIIFDLTTRRWRAYRPFDPNDLARRHEARESPPLVPKRLVESVAWYQKKTRIPRKVTLTTGWTLHFWSGEGTPPQGSRVDIAWLDEEIRNRGWVPEMSARLADRDGKMIWSATPQNGTDQFFDLSQQAEVERGSPTAVVEEFLPSLLDNPHISQKAKEQLAQSYTDEAERLVRIHGEFSLSAKKIYPEFNRNAHGLAWEGEIPDTWTRYAVVDPGYQVCGVLFAACPDPADQLPVPFDVLLYDELYLTACSAAKFGEAFQRKTEGQRFEAFVIDMHGARVHDVGSGKSVLDQYVAELAKRNIRSARTGSGFAPGNDDLKGGIEKVRSYLAVGNAGRPRLRVLSDRTEYGLLVPRLSNFDYEILRYRYKKAGDLVTDEPDERGRVHLMACVRYLCQYGPRFVYGSRGAEDLSPAYAAFLKDQRDRDRTTGRVTVFGPASHLKTG